MHQQQLTPKSQTKFYKQAEIGQMCGYTDEEMKDRILGDLQDGNFKRIELLGVGNRELMTIDRVKQLICGQLKIADQSFIYDGIDSQTHKPTRRVIFDLCPGSKEIVESETRKFISASNLAVRKVTFVDIPKGLTSDKEN